MATILKTTPASQIQWTAVLQFRELNSSNTTLRTCSINLSKQHSATSTSSQEPSQAIAGKLSKVLVTKANSLSKRSSKVPNLRDILRNTKTRPNKSKRRLS